MIRGDEGRRIFWRGTVPDGPGRTLYTVATVFEGEVAVYRGQSPPLTDAGTGGEAQHVRTGYQLRIDAEEASAQPVPVDVAQALSWLQHKIVFEQRPLGGVAEEFNRYARIPLVIEDDTLRALPISGVFDAYDTDSFATFLASLEGVTVQKTPTQVRVRATPK